ncbi:unnamed protein product, partial [Medioppia subpectinata]
MFKLIIVTTITLNLVNHCICVDPEIQFSHSDIGASFILKCELHYDKSEATFSRFEISKDSAIYFTYGENKQKNFKRIDGIDRLEMDTSFMQTERVSSYAHVENEIKYGGPQ